MYSAIAEVNYYEMEGEWNLVTEAVVGTPCETLEEAKAACLRREYDSIDWVQHSGKEWVGYAENGLVTFYISKT